MAQPRSTAAAAAAAGSTYISRVNREADDGDEQDWPAGNVRRSITGICPIRTVTTIS